MALERAFTLGRDVGQDEHGRRPGGNAAANGLSSAWEKLAQHPHNGESMSEWSKARCLLALFYSADTTIYRCS